MLTPCTPARPVSMQFNRQARGRRTGGQVVAGHSNGAGGCERSSECIAPHLELVPLAGPHERERLGGARGQHLVQVLLLQFGRVELLARGVVHRDIGRLHLLQLLGHQVVVRLVAVREVGLQQVRHLVTRLHGRQRGLDGSDGGGGHGGNADEAVGTVWVDRLRRRVRHGRRLPALLREVDLHTARAQPVNLVGRRLRLLVVIRHSRRRSRRRGGLLRLVGRNLLLGNATSSTHQLKL
jgi:hypothetical protein